MPGKTKVQEELAAVQEYITTQYMTASVKPEPKDISSQILKLTYARFDAHNAVLGKQRADERFQKSTKLTPSQMELLLRSIYVIKNVDLFNTSISASRKETSCLGIYDNQNGIYDIKELSITEYIERIQPDFTEKDVNEVLRKLKINSPVTIRTQNPDLIPVNNGIFNYKTKELMPFSPDYVYLTKCPVDYVQNPINPVLHNNDDGTDWDVESWMQSLSDDQEIVDLLWQVLGAVIRPGVRWNKAAYLYATSGNNGKGTFCELARALCGEGNHVSLSIHDFDSPNRFTLEPLIYASAVITDENNVEEYIDCSRNLKSAVTGDTIQIDRKYKPSIVYRFQGFIIQCLNDLPRVKDKSDSYARRQLLIPFEKCFTGTERKYIKNDYLQQKEVLQYVLWKILQTSYYELNCPRVSMELLEEYQSVNDPVRGFCEEIVTELQWEFVPFKFLYELYTAWMRTENPNGRPLNSKNFINHLLEILKTKDFGFYCDDKRKPIRTGNRMTKPEPFIKEYNLINWMNPTYNGNDINKICIPGAPAKKDLDRGILKKPQNIMPIRQTEEKSI